MQTSIQRQHIALKKACLTQTTFLADTKDPQTGQPVTVLYERTWTTSGVEAIPLALLLDPEQAAGYPCPARAMDNQFPHEKDMEQIVTRFMNYFFKGLFEELFKRSFYQLPYLSKSSKAVLEKLKKDLTACRYTLAVTMHAIAFDAQAHLRWLSSPAARYENTKASFLQFQSTRRTLSPAEWFKHADIPEEEYELFEPILQVHIYDQCQEILELKPGEVWESSPFKLVRARYCCVINGDETYENNDLLKVERKLFREFIRRR